MTAAKHSDPWKYVQIRVSVFDPWKSVLQPQGRAPSRLTEV